MTTCSKDPERTNCLKKKKGEKLKPTEAELWLNMMSSMLNFAMASTTLMKSIQNRVEVTRQLEEETRAMHATEFFKQEMLRTMEENKINSEDFSLRIEPIRMEKCGEHTCGLIFKNKDADQCDPMCEGKKITGSHKSPPCVKKKKPCLESVDTLGGSCLCFIPPKEDLEKDVKEECSCIQIKECVKDFDDEEPSCVCSDDEDREQSEKLNECAANKIIETKSDCSCPSFVSKEVGVVGDSDEGKPVEKETSIIDCGCQTTSSEELMIKELQLANLSYQMRQTDKNLKDLKKEMERLTNFMGGKKKCTYASAAALYEEIMKPMKSLETTSCRRKRL